MFSSNPGRVLIVDDEVNSLKATAAILKLNGVKDVVTEADSRKVAEIMESGGIDVVLLDLYMPHVNGMELLAYLHQSFPQTPVVIVTAAYELERAVECIKSGAFDYLVKPVDADRMILTLQKAFECQAINEQLVNLRDHLVEDRLDHPEMFSEIVSGSRKMRAIFQYLEVIAKSPQPVLITGESGTGKELISRVIHHLSGCKGELVSVNLAGLDDTMFSDTLFGHKKGAFTGADQLRDGLIVKAAQGVILLDEIGDLGESSQIRLLRLIQEREFYPVGSDMSRKSDARIVCASNKNLKELVAAGRFRNDLYYRLNVHHVDLPPLRERKEDIPLLLEHFLAKAAKTLNKKKPTAPQELPTLLQLYAFPGNIREFEALVFDAVAQHQSGILSMEYFRKIIDQENPQPSVAPEKSADNSLSSYFGHFPTIREVEVLMISEAMTLAKGNQGMAASLLGITRQTLNNRLKIGNR